MIAATIGLAGCATHPVDAYTKLAHLDQGTLLASGHLPPAIAGVDPAILPSSVRMLVSYEGIDYWAGATADNEICFIAEGAETVASCADADHFGRYGSTLEIAETGQRVWLHTEYMTVGPSWTAISPSVAIRG
ncbi:hypothetical protein VD659_13920 [Herbiconiux sp. 11R-BC]|uniref:hypothetical protein n=1 Tax=Herbiconiux sp. 11R-BC TaxID=3111637 RepID=UPI003C07C53D